MQLDSPQTIEDLERSAKKPKITIHSDKLKKYQRIHAMTVSLVPLLGTAMAIVMAFKWGISLVDMGLLVGMYTLSLAGITIGFHRHFAHRTFEANTFVRVVLGILGSMTCQGPLIYWVSNHRRHHQYSDRPGDVHSPYFKGDKKLAGLSGFWHSHIGWTFDHEITNTLVFAKDLLQDPMISKINQLYYIWIGLGFAIPAILGGLLTGSWLGALSGLLWGGFARLLISYHATLSINSITHLYGSRTFDTKEYSTNNIWLAIPTLGESWHNNHHAFPNSAKFGLEWWQVDLGYWGIWVLRLMGAVEKAKVPNREMIAAKKSPPGYK